MLAHLRRLNPKKELSVPHSRSSQVAVLDNGCGSRVFAKIYPAHASLEYLKGKQIYEASLSSGVFCAPRPLVLIQSQEVVVWEWLDNLIQMREYLMQHQRNDPSSSTTRLQIFRDCGRTLAILHASLSFESDKRHFWPPPQIRSPSEALTQHVESTLRGSTCRHVHGDFTPPNIFLRTGTEGTSQLAVIDASPNTFLFGCARTDIVTSVYLDVALFACALNSTRRFCRQLGHELPLYLEEFVCAYEQESEEKLDRATVLACSAHIMLAKRKHGQARTRCLSIDRFSDARFRMTQAARLFKEAMRHF